MSKARLLGLVDSDSEDGLGASTAAKKKTDTMPPAKRPRGRPPANKVTKPAPKTAARRNSDRMAAAIENEGEREVLAEKSTNHQPSAAGTRGRKPGTKKIDVEDEEVEIPETQQEADGMEMDQDDDSSAHVEDLPAAHRSVPMSAQRASKFTALGSARRPTSASDSDDSDLSLRRRLGDLTKKYESMEAKYRDLREIGVKEAERNFDRLKKQGEERANGEHFAFRLVHGDYE